MSTPVLARLDDAGDRFYVWRGQAFYSVTTILNGGVPKYGLPRWYAGMAAAEAYGDLAARGPYARAHAALRRWTRNGRLEVVARQAAGDLTSIDLTKLTDEDLALRFLKGAPERRRGEAAALGIDVHDEAEQLVQRLALDSAEAYQDSLALPAWPDAIAGYGAGFMAFLDDWHPIYRATEATVFSRDQAYAGTGDAWMGVVAEGHGPLELCVDYKSGRAIYAEVAMQLAAYRRGQFIGSPDRETELELPVTSAGAVLHLLPKPTRKWPRGYAFRLVRTDDTIYEAFLFAREVYRWGKQTSKTAILDPLIPADRKELAS